MKQMNTAVTHRNIDPAKKKSWVLKATYSLAAFNKVLEHTKLIHGGTSKSSGGKNGSWQQV